LALALVATPAWASSAAEGHRLGTELGLWTLLPFIGMLLSIAVLPLLAHHWWENNRNRGIVAAIFGLPIGIYLVVAFGAAGGEELIHKAKEYISFIVLLLALFAITGGIYVRGSLSGTPLVNTAIMAIGAVLASIIGTTGASVLLIRPLLRANQARTRKVHIVVFFIFIVSNCGGLLTPLGDPPLFLGYLKGVPFLWTMGLWKEWLLVNAALLLIFNFWDQRVLAKEEAEKPGALLEEVMRHEPFSIRGGMNFLFLFGVVAVIFSSGAGYLNGAEPWPFGIQEAAMLLLAIIAYKTTATDNRVANRFTWGPIVEVAVLFAGIFVTMAPALLILNAWGDGSREVFGMAFGLNSPGQYFWATGVLSSFLDNAPTYLTFSATAAGQNHIALEGRFLAEMVHAAPQLLAAISCGAVFMGANTYIGNGPNFMVKAIAEENGVKMPAFFAYMAYSIGILVPLFVVVTLLFFRS
jgi:Na+/H+ antiporter NhaD/arsenite permease-like protein